MKRIEYTVRIVLPVPDETSFDVMVGSLKQAILCHRISEPPVIHDAIQGNIIDKIRVLEDVLYERDKGGKQGSGEGLS